MLRIRAPHGKAPAQSLPTAQVPVGFLAGGAVAPTLAAASSGIAPGLAERRPAIARRPS
jgi:hypothetical protein